MPSEIADHIANISVIDTHTHLPGDYAWEGPNALTSSATFSDGIPRRTCSSLVPRSTPLPISRTAATRILRAASPMWRPRGT